MLKEAAVETLIDVRELPISRKPGFSKGVLAAEAEAQGVCYIHLRSFGCPRPIRHDYREDGDWPRYLERFMAYLDKQDVAITDLYDRVMESRCCLLCFEADPLRCHRSLVADRVGTESEGQIQVRHLTAL
jgi:uncharacterized protein (DUF488 family)